MIRLLVAVVLIGAPSLARAQGEAAHKAVHPIYAAVSVDSPQDRDARRRFGEAAAKFGLGTVETVDIPGPPEPKAQALLRAGMAAVEVLRFDEAQVALDAAAAEVANTGAAGLSPAELADLFLFQATALQKADWKDLPTPFTDIAPPGAKDAYLRAATLTPERVLPPRQFRPLVVASWQKAVAEIQARPRGAILVRAAPSAQISIDGGAALLSPAVAQNLPYGDHVIRGEDLGRKPWVVVVSLSLPTLEVDMPETPALALDPADAAAHARRMGASFGLVASLKRGAALDLQLSLIDARTGTQRDATVVPLGGDAGTGGLLEATVMRLDEQARKDEVRGQGRDAEATGPPFGLALAPPAPAPATDAPRLSSDPVGWARAHWPLVTAVGACVGTALILGLVVAHDDRMAIR